MNNSLSPKRQDVAGTASYESSLQSDSLSSEPLVAIPTADIALADYPSFAFQMRDIRRAGEALRGDLLWTPETEAQVLAVFQIANSWRDSHAFPMQSIRQEVVAKIKACKLDGITAARLKRMISIRKKLRKEPGNLNQMQDLGGCRAILPSIADVQALVAHLSKHTPHEIKYQRDYIANPKPGGYRCHHLIFLYNGTGARQIHNGRRIELQVRTRLQHSWATAVEAVGLYMQQDLKGGAGDADWLRLFDLISSEFAIAERCPESKHVPERSVRIAEIRDIDRRINARQTLENLRRAFRLTDPIYTSQDRPSHYRIEYDYETRTVTVRPHSKPLTGISENNVAEQANAQGGRQVNTVYIEADKVEHLKAAYPNYFGDVQVFNSNLQMIVEGKEAIEFTEPPRRTAPIPPREPKDHSWLRPGKRRRWFEVAKGPARSKRPRPR